jgi:hypothetical protein
MTDHYSFRCPNPRTGGLEKETHALNFGNLIAVVNFRVFARLLKMPPVVNRCGYNLAWISDGGFKLHLRDRDSRLTVCQLSDVIAQAV